MEMSGQVHFPASLPPVPIKREAAWVPEPIGRSWRREKYLALTGIPTPNRSLVALPTGLLWLPEMWLRHKCLTLTDTKTIGRYYDTDIEPFKYEAQTALFKDPVRTAQ